MTKFLSHILFNRKLCQKSSLFNFKAILNRPVLKKSFVFRNSSSFNPKVMQLSSVIKVIEEILPTKLAETWDNTGLLVEPVIPCPISTVFLTNDLTEEVLNEAVEAKANLIISYHPPIFTGMKALVSKNWKERVVMGCIEKSIAVYSPHTASDAVEGGVNDWLIRCFGLTNVKPIKPVGEKGGIEMECLIPKAVNLDQLLGSELHYETLETCGYDETTMVYKILVQADMFSAIHEKLNEDLDLCHIKRFQYRKTNHLSSIGMGRIGKLAKPLKLGICIEMMKKHAKVNNIRVCIGANKSLDTDISIIAACAGSGGSLLQDVPADLYVTGEMSHHDLLNCQQKSISVILCEHSNSERGYLHDLAGQLQSKLHDVKIIVSSTDKDPISIH